MECTLRSMLLLSCLPNQEREVLIMIVKFLVKIGNMKEELIEARSYQEALGNYIRIKKELNECRSCFGCTNTKHVHRWVEN
jgi:hypothetical protein